MSDSPQTRTLPPVAVLVSHTVANFDQWKKAFDASQADRKAAGVLGHHINRGADNPNLVALYLAVSDRKKIEEFIASPKLKETMKEAGVTSAPEISFVKPMEDRHIGDRRTAALMITADVEDYAAWKKGYDSGADLRAKRGIIGYAINQMADSPNTIVVYHQAENLQALRDFVADPEIKEAMKRSGIKGAPRKVEFFEAVGGAAY